MRASSEQRLQVRRPARRVGRDRGRQTTRRHAVKQGRVRSARWSRPLALAAVLGATLFGATAATAEPTVFATGLDNPRGLTFGPDGNLYVAEAGTGGDTSTIGMCPQVGPPIGPYTGGDTATVTRIAPDGSKSVAAGGLPSATEAIGDIEGA